MNRDLARQLVNVVATVLMIVVNVLANALPLNGQNTGAISDRFHIYFVPAGYVFAIWGLIYLALIGFAVYQALPSQRENPRLRRIGYLYAVSSALNILWIFLWHYNVFAGTIIVMLGLLATLIAIYVRLGIGIAPVKTAERWLINVPFSIYLGWISVATIANASQFLFYLNWNGWGIVPQVWAIIMILAATFIGLLMSLLRRDIAYTLVLIWAFVGIGVKHLAEPAVAVIAVAWFAALLLILMVIFVALRRFRPRSLPAV
jgi:benzodiazapine receptor